MQDVQNKVAKDSVEKRVTEEKSPPQVGTSTPDAAAHEIEKARNYKSGKCQYVSNPVANRAVRPEFVNEIKTFGRSTSEGNTQDDSCGNPRNKIPVVSILHRQFSLKVAAGQQIDFDSRSPHRTSKLYALPPTVFRIAPLAWERVRLCVPISLRTVGNIFAIICVGDSPASIP
jgi:hypothetical protein